MTGREVGDWGKRAWICQVCGQEKSPLSLGVTQTACSSGFLLLAVLPAPWKVETENLSVRAL